MKTQAQSALAKNSPENIERLLHARSEKTLADLLMSARVLSANPMRPRIRPKTTQQIKVEIDPFSRLSRIGDDVVIQISASSNPTEAAGAPGIWIDQSNFTIKKVRFPSQSEFVASQHIELSQNLLFPKIRNVVWGQNSVEVRLLKVNSVSKSKDLERDLSNAALSSPLQWGSSSLATQLKEFYTRFR